MTSSSDAATNSYFDQENDLFLPLFYTIKAAKKHFFSHQNINLDVYFNLEVHKLSKINVYKSKSSIDLPWLRLELQFC